MLQKFKEMVQNFFAKMHDEEGQGLVEYALIIVLVSIVCVVALGILGTSVRQVFTNINTSLNP